MRIFEILGLPPYLVLWVLVLCTVGLTYHWFSLDSEVPVQGGPPETSPSGLPG